MGQKTALVTGAGRGIGFGIAELLIKSGYRVAAHYNSGSTGIDKLIETARQTKGEVFGIRADLSDYSGVESMMAAVRGQFGALDLLVYNSGVTICKPLSRITVEDVETVTGVDWKGGFFTTQLAAELMKSCGGGSIILITSNQAHMVYPDGALYGSIKAALSHFIKSAAIELAPCGIRVNGIAPGYTDTGDPRMGEKESTYASIPMARWCTPEEIAHAVLFLDSEWAKSITGVDLLIDGGGSLTCKDDRKH